MKYKTNQQYLIWMAIGAIVSIISLGVAIIVSNDFGNNYFIWIIVFLCCNTIGWLFYLLIKTLIFDIYKIMFGKKDMTMELGGTLEGNKELIFKKDIIEQKSELYRKAKEKEEEEKKQKIENAIREYIHYSFKDITTDDIIEHIRTEVQHWMTDSKYEPKPIEHKLKITTHSLRHFIWNISVRFYNKDEYKGEMKAKFIKELFINNLKDIDLSTLKNLKENPQKGPITIDEPENDNYNFHYQPQYTPTYTF